MNNDPGIVTKLKFPRLPRLSRFRHDTTTAPFLILNEKNNNNRTRKNICYR